MKDFPMELLVDVEDGVQFPLRISVTLAQLVDPRGFRPAESGVQVPHVTLLLRYVSDGRAMRDASCVVGVFESPTQHL